MLGYIIGLGIAGVLGYWVYTDAKKRGMDAGSWGIFTFLLAIIGLPLYLIKRGDNPLPSQNILLRVCLSCGRQIIEKTSFCPHCGVEITQ